MCTKWPPAIAVLGLCIALVPSLSAQDNFTHPRIISVTGTAEIKVKPDEVVLTLGVDSHDRELIVAKADNDRRVKKLLSLARSEGVDPKDIQTSALTMDAEYSEEKIPKLLGYQVSQTLTVTLTDLSKYEDLMTNALKAGVNRVGGIDFTVAHPEKYREEARLQALQAARDKAAGMAALLGQKIGKPWEIIEDADMGYPYPMANFAVSRKMAIVHEEDAGIAGGEVTIQAFVRASFQLE